MRTEQNTAQNYASEIMFVSQINWHVKTVVPLTNFRLDVAFVDGVHGIVDMNRLIHSASAGVFSALKDPVLFNQVYIEHGAVTWPGEIDLAPDAMYEEIKQHGERVLK